MRPHIETLDLPADSMRQYINARQLFTALRETELAAQAFRGGMIWRAKENQAYLVRTTVSGAQKGLGPRSSETEAIYEKFTSGKQQVEERRAQLRASLARAQRVNKALFVGRIDDKVIDVLNALYEAGLEDTFTVIGTNALYAYEAAAGVRIEERHLATNDLDLLWDNRRKLTLALKENLPKRGLLGLLKRIDKTFELRPGQLYTAVNQDGYEIDIIRRLGPGSDDEPAQLTGDEDDFWAVRARNADWLLSAPKFKEVIVGASGRMAHMVTIDPRAFVLFKLWMMRQKDRDPLKRARDGNQAKVVIDLISERLPQFDFEEIKVFPSEVAKMVPAEFCRPGLASGTE
jgi:hypothetical protein